MGVLRVLQGVNSCNNEHPFKKLKMSEPMTLEENEDVIELD